MDNVVARLRRPDHPLALRSTTSVAVVSALAAVAVSPVVALAHAGPPPAPASFWQDWSFQPGLLLGLLIAGWLYFTGLRRIWRHAGRDRGVRVWQAQCFVAALAVVFVALLSPLDGLSSALFAAHMVQHLLLILVAAPLFLLGTPLAPAVWALPARYRRTLGRTTHAPWPHAIWHFVQRPLVAWMLAAAFLWLWHLPVLYQAALRSEPIHATEHACLFGSALLFWNALIGRSASSRLSTGPAVIYIFTMALQSTALGIALAFSSSPWYPAYASTTIAWHLSPAEDQQIAGLIMWIPAGAVYLAAALAILARGIMAEERELPLARTPNAPPSGTSGQVPGEEIHAT